MPAIGNLVVKADDDTTDVTYSALTGSGGDSSPAMWRAPNPSWADGPLMVSSTYSLQAQWSGKGRTARRSYSRFVMPYALSDVNGIIRVVSSLFVNVEVLQPYSMPQDISDEGVSQAFNLLVASKAGWKEGFSYV